MTSKSFQADQISFARFGSILGNLSSLPKVHECLSYILNPPPPPPPPQIAPHLLSHAIYIDDVHVNLPLSLDVPRGSLTLKSKQSTFIQPFGQTNKNTYSKTWS